MTSDGLTILIVDDEVNMRRILDATLHREGYRTVTAEHGAGALSVLKSQPVDIVLTDLKMPGIDGMTLLRECNAQYPGIPLIMLTAHGTVETAVEAMKIGAFDYITKPFDIGEIRNALQKASALVLRNRDAYLTGSVPAQDSVESASAGTVASGGIITSNRHMKEVLSLVNRVADSPSTILITGESGTGKELIAGLIHEQSSRRAKPFIKVNCAAIPETLLESEFFGHERGAFTGAVTCKPGRFELADGGSLFLDEISEISTEIQVKLLRAIQERQFERVGGIRTLSVDVRIIAATNTDLGNDVSEGRFRRDLYYRLNVVPIHLPALRDRREDIMPLAAYFLSRMNQRLGKSVEGISDEAMAILEQHTWPGNIRELENVIERAVLLCSEKLLRAQDLNLIPIPEGVSIPKETPAAQLKNGVSLKEIIQTETDRVEFNLLIDALTRTGGNVTRAAQVLGVSRKGLQLKLRRHGIDPRNLPERPDFS